MSDIEFDVLRDGGQTAQEIAERVAAFMAPATSSLDIALYDLRLGEASGAIVVNAVHAAVARGVAVRLMLNVDHRKVIPVPPPPTPNPPHPPLLDVPTKLIPGVPDLMHHKYVIRDHAAVWTGSTNWTEDSWTREENVLLRVVSAEVAAAYTVNFEGLWADPIVAESGKSPTTLVDIGDSRVQPWFCPGQADHLVHRMAAAMGAARQRIRIASPVLTSGPILATLAELSSRRAVDIAGVLDATQMAEVYGQWRSVPRSRWKLSLIAQVLTAVPFTGKHSTPYTPQSVHDYMHAKVLVADDTVFIGSFNLSHSGEMNAENVVEVRNAALADRAATFIDETRSRFPALVPPAL